MLVSADVVGHFAYTECSVQKRRNGRKGSGALSVGMSDSALRACHTYRKATTLRQKTPSTAEHKKKRGMTAACESFCQA